MTGTDCGDAAPVADGDQPSTGELIPDLFAGEIAAIYAVRDRGLVVISSCGHAGIINTVRRAQQVTGLEHVHAVVGGWHLADATEDVIDRTVNAWWTLLPTISFRCIAPDSRPWLASSGPCLAVSSSRRWEPV